MLKLVEIQAPTQTTFTTLLTQISSTERLLGQLAEL
jgi:hypothetical protein